MGARQTKPVIVDLDKLSEEIVKLEKLLINDCTPDTLYYKQTLLLWKVKTSEKAAAIAAIAEERIQDPEYLSNEIKKLKNLLIYDFLFDSEFYNHTLLLWNKLLLKKVAFESDFGIVDLPMVSTDFE